MSTVLTRLYFKSVLLLTEIIYVNKPSFVEDISRFLKNEYCRLIHAVNSIKQEFT